MSAGPVECISVQGKKSVRAQPQVLWPGGDRQTASGRFAGERERRDAGSVGRHRVVAAVLMAAARLTFFFDVADFPAGGDFAIAPDDAPARQCGEAEKSNETHTINPRCSQRSKLCALKRCTRTEQLPQASYIRYIGAGGAAVHVFHENPLVPRNNPVVWIEAVLLQPDGTWLHLRHPTRIIETSRASDVVSTIDAVERAALTSDCYAVGFVTYEAASAFGLVTQTPVNGLPLVWFALFERRTAASLPTPFASETLGGYQLGSIEPSIDRERFMAAFTTVRARLAAGDSYQANYTFAVRASFDGDARAFFAALARAQQGRYATFLTTGARTICSASPELFFARTGNIVSARPMKGTVRRGLTADEDRRQRTALVGSDKQRAENVMIVDMVRNDLGRIADVGSVDVPELFTAEKYPTVWQMTSLVQARSSSTLAELFAAVHPCASITGAPKASTMAILASLEDGPRGIYTGALGYVAPDGSARFSVAIRTAVIDHGSRTLDFGVGSGIVWDSDGPSEYDESLLKAAILTYPSPPPFELLETMRWDPDEGFLLLNRHLGRMAASAGYFDFAYDEPHVRAVLDDAVRSAATRRRLRLLLARDGQVRVEQADWRAGAAPVRAALATTAVDSQTVWLFHKTTNRAVYDDRRRHDVDETILWNERGEVTEATTANLVAAIGGRRITPPITSGLLAGTYRAELLERGAITEAPLSIADVRAADRLWLINSVQEWREVTLVD